MRKMNIVILVVALVLSVSFTAVRTVSNREVPIDQVAAVQQMGSGNTLLATYESNKIVLRKINEKGQIKSSHSISRKRDGNIVSLVDIGMDDSGLIYLLKDIIEPESSQLKAQELEIYDMSKLMSKRQSRVEMPLKNGVVYRWMNVSSTVVLLGTNEVVAAPKAAGVAPTKIIREAYEPASLYGKNLPEPKGQREYAVAQSEGVYQVIIAGADVAYVAKTGRVYSVKDAEGAQPQRVFPLALDGTLKYALYLSDINRDTAFIGVQGDEGYLTAVNLNDGGLARQNSFMSESAYSAADIRAMSMRGMSDFSAIVHKGDSPLAMVVANNGKIHDITSLRQSTLGFVLTTVLTFALSLAVLLIIGQVISQLILLATEGRTILAKLVVTSVPLILVALAFFGVFSYRTYASSIELSFQKQVRDEGAMLIALFGTDTLFGTDEKSVANVPAEEVYEGLEYPYDFGGKSYQYIMDQMRKREVYTSLSYYEGDKLSVVVEKDQACFYPFDVRLDTNAQDMYVRAAKTGSPQVGVINDGAGRRIVCVSPIGGTSAEAVCLLETGVQYINLENYTNSFLRIYLIVSAVFVIIIAVALTFLFMRVLMPIGQIKRGLQEFADSEGKKHTKLEVKATAEFSDIINVFNKMADDINRQIFRLDQTNKTYYHFVPKGMIELWGKENLSEVKLGTGIEREANVLCISMEMNIADMTTAQEQEVTNRFFGIFNRAAEQFGGTVVTDNVNLRRLRIICPDSGDNAVDMAVSALAVVDSANATLPVQCQMKVMVVLHKTRIFYGICGDRERLVPTMLSDDLDYIIKNESKLRGFSRRLLVTEAAAGNITPDRYYRRFVGYPNGTTERRFGLHDFYDASPADEIRLINDTRVTFDKAMELMEAERWYDAKNFFALVLRQNQYDNVARHYIFICEQNLQPRQMAQ